jgi:tetrapyrrole methylase family protein / MazG family protein
VTSQDRILGRVTIVGLGPGGPELVTQQTLDAIAAHPHRFVRTTRHPSAALVGAATSFDDVYEAADKFADV